MTDTPEAVRLADPIKPLADAPIVAWCIESTDSADWCWSATRDGVIDNAKFLDDGCAPGEPFAVIRQADHQAQMNALLRRIPELETARDVAVELAAQYAAERDQLRAELDARWQPIETAPKDGTNVLLINRALNQAAGLWMNSISGVGWYLRGGIGPDVFFNSHYGPTHWMPLPAAPTPPNADQKGQL